MGDTPCDTPLDGKVALVTGASRGIGEAPGVEYHGLTKGVPEELIERPEEFAETALWLCTGPPAERTGRIDESRRLQAEIGAGERQRAP
jgi:hypothetical protein